MNYFAHVSPMVIHLVLDNYRKALDVTIVAVLSIAGLTAVAFIVIGGGMYIESLLHKWRVAK